MCARELKSLAGQADRVAHTLEDPLIHRRVPSSLSARPPHGRPPTLARAVPAVSACCVSGRLARAVQPARPVERTLPARAREGGMGVQAAAVMCISPFLPKTRTGPNSSCSFVQVPRHDTPCLLPAHDMPGLERQPLGGPLGPPSGCRATFGALVADAILTRHDAGKFPFSLLKPSYSGT